MTLSPNSPSPSQSVKLRSPLLVIVGPTASGKTALSLRIAQQYNGEIICADSRTLYRGFDIGTAKPTKSEQQQVRHHLIDVLKPGEPFSAKQFKDLATAAIQDIQSRGSIPIMVGGTGLYIDAVLFDYQFKGRSYSADRDDIEVDALVLGLSVEKPLLKQRIRSRVEMMLNNNFIHEAEVLYKRHGPDCPQFEIIGYRHARSYIRGEIDKSELIERFVRDDYQLARRQMTWLKRNPAIRWLAESATADKYIRHYLKK